MISISQYDPGADIGRQLLLGQGFHAACRADRHKYGRKDFPMVGADLPRPRRRMRTDPFQFELQFRHNSAQFTTSPCHENLYFRPGGRRSILSPAIDRL
jgi:hypothetical protein